MVESIRYGDLISTLTGLSGYGMTMAPRFAGLSGFVMIVRVFGTGFSSGLHHSLSRVVRVQDGINPLVHQPALVNAFLTDNDGNVGGSLRGDVKPRRISRQIAVQVPANADVTELERGCDTATHIESTLYRLWFSRIT
jgi:hypothetical protein